MLSKLRVPTTLHKRISKPAMARLLRGSFRTAATKASEAGRVSKLLIANRGEIACRIIDTARSMGVKTVAVYSDVDANAQHVLMADEAYNIGPADSNKSYLRYEKIIDVAKESGADAIHPGYGFLSENAKFATLLPENGIEFVGPPADAIRAMGVKSESKRIMIEANVPCVPGYHGDDQSDERLVAEAQQMGFPIMIKAVLGGGGKGMRIAMTEDEFMDQLEAARQEARNAFDDDAMLLERYIKRSRHVEVQVFGDKHGQAVYLFERDCSLQRRHQKVVEEAPAPGLSDELRKELGEAAVRAALAVNYVGAGTVEFIMDTADNKFYFMEMNTRLQVEHPITEMINGVDLVEWQLKIAAGQPLPVTQDDLKINGHSFEARVYAETPLKNFRPGSGPLLYMKRPKEADDVRVDSGVIQGDNVSVYYDPMIAKLVVWGEDRGAALGKLKSSLREFHIAGLNTNIDFMCDIADHPQFQAGDVSTAFIEENQDVLLNAAPPSFHALAQTGLAFMLNEASQRESTCSDDTMSPWNSKSLQGFQISGSYTSRRLTLEIDEEEYEIVMTPQGEGSYTVQYGDQESVISGRIVDGAIKSRIDGRSYSATPFHTNDSLDLFTDEGQIHATFPDPAFASSAAALGGDVIVAPMDGAIQEVLVQPGDEVEADQPVLVMYAMKMQTTLRAPRSGKVATIAAPGQVTLNAVLFTMADDEDVAESE